MSTIAKPIYNKAPQHDIFKQMKQEVQRQVLDNSTLYRQNVAKAIVYVCLFLGSYLGILAWGNNTALLFLLYIVCGISMILLFLNAFHDAAHGALFKSKKFNMAFVYILEIFGSNNYVWRKRHLLLHHPYPNVPNWDIDVKQSDVARIFPTAKWLPMHTYQHIYMWFLYPLYTLNWLFIRDFKDFFVKKDNYVKRILTIPRIEYYKMFAAKLFNIFYMIVLPVILLQAQPWYMILPAWITMHLVSSCFGTIALLSTHVDEDAHFPETDKDGHLNNTWFMHQLDVTKDFSTNSRLANLLFGGFSHHVAHHLFPNIAHTYYPAITRIIKKYAEANDLPYRSYPFYSAIKSHFRLLKKNGHQNNLFKAGEL